MHWIAISRGIMARIRTKRRFAGTLPVNKHFNMPMELF
jgi:hypothetical protein